MINNELQTIIDSIISICEPVSIFLYGSRAKGDYNENSDYEIGIVYKKEDKVSLQKIQETINNTKVSAYPFTIEDIKNCKIDTPFQKKIFLYELIKVGRTIYGTDIFTELTLPQITNDDILQDVRFYVGLSLAAIMSDRNGDKSTASDIFYKSCLYGFRDLIILEGFEFPTTYKAISEYCNIIEIPNEFKNLIKTAINIREGTGEYKRSDLYKNISFLNNYIENKILDSNK